MLWLAVIETFITRTKNGKSRSWRDDYIIVLARLVRKSSIIGVKISVLILAVISALILFVGGNLAKQLPFFGGAFGTMATLGLLIWASTAALKSTEGREATRTKVENGR
jgi:hypothetical protein